MVGNEDRSTMTKLFLNVLRRALEDFKLGHFSTVACRATVNLLAPTTSEAPVGGKLGGPCAPDDYRLSLWPKKDPGPRTTPPLSIKRDSVTTSGLDQASTPATLPPSPPRPPGLPTVHRCTLFTLLHRCPTLQCGAYSLHSSAVWTFLHCKVHRSVELNLKGASFNLKQLSFRS
jgi:hypothetical protein